ncbi:MAG: hypothetical protein JWO36_3536 [Myxococcales bacterium]|nr:hypothetical protein [Myxococcales bacterium]
MAMTWGGAREGAGRRARGPIASEPHRRRPMISARFPVHITARVVPALRGLARRMSYRAIRGAITKSFARSDFRVVQLAVSRHRLELVVEAEDKFALARGMQGLQVAAARALNRAASRRGTVFPDRYRARILNTRSVVRAAIAHLPTSRSREAWPQTWLLVIELARSARRDRKASG